MAELRPGGQWCLGSSREKSCQVSKGNVLFETAEGRLFGLKLNFTVCAMPVGGNMMANSCWN